MSDVTEAAGMEFRNDELVPCGYSFLKKQGVLDIRFREYDIAVLP